MRELGIDIETYSDLDIARCGAYKYSESEAFDILLFGYSIDHAPAVCVDLASGEELPAEVLAALTDPTVRKTAYNAAFERVCLSRWLNRKGMLANGEMLDPAQWHCTMARAAHLALPLPLGQCAEALRIEEGKMSEGAALIRYFSKSDRNGNRRMPDADPEKWDLFKQYNRRDVDVEQAILAKVRRLEQPAWEREVYVLDQRINDLGVMCDRRLAEAASRMDAEYKEQLLAEAREITGLENPNSPAQLKEWIARETGQRVSSLSKASMEDLEESMAYWPKVRRALALRRQMGKTSNAKYGAMLDCLCKDGRIHGLTQYYGSRTGRWAGRLVQVQNLPQNHLDDLEEARRIARGGDLEEMALCYDNPAQVLSEIIRTAFVGERGLLVSDFSAIEARVIAWLAGEKWVLDVFEHGGDVYCATASQMFGVPVEKHGANSHLRQKGKIAVLALGYGGGVAALEAMGGGKMGLSPDEMAEIVDLWRRSNPNIVRLWRNVESAAIAAIETRRPQTIHRGIVIDIKWGFLTIALPSGRVLCYPRAATSVEADWRGERAYVLYEGVNQTSRKWCSIRTYGGKMVENIVQAIARDILALTMLRAAEKGYRIVFHVHDEIVAEADEGKSLDEFVGLFSEPVEWAKGLPLKGAGFASPYYMKD